MILKGSQRGGAAALGAHLLKAENEHIEVHEIRGFAADNLPGAMKEAQAVAKGTRCKQHLFSVSLSPPEREPVSVAKFEAAVDRIEAANGLTGQPRVILFHEKEGRRHAHAVWSRIDAATMTARPLPFFKQKLRQVSKGLYLEHGWQMPRGLMDSKERDPRNFSLAEWQQAKRVGRDAKQLKAVIQECWAVSDGRPAFEKALETRGLYLAKGDRRAHVAVTYEGEVVSIARATGAKTKDVAVRLGKADELRSVADTKLHIASAVGPRLQSIINEADRNRSAALQPLEERRIAMRASHAAERERLDRGQEIRRNAEARERAQRLRSGVAGMWDRLTGRRAETIRQNDAEALSSIRRDRDQRDNLVVAQLDERRDLQRDIRSVRARHAETLLELHRDLANQEKERGGENVSKSFNDAAEPQARPRQTLRRTERTRGAARDGPSPSI